MIILRDKYIRNAIVYNYANNEFVLYPEGLRYGWLDI